VFSSNQIFNIIPDKDSFDKGKPEAENAANPSEKRDNLHESQ